MTEPQWKDYWASTLGTILILPQLVLWFVLGSGGVVWLVVTGVTLLLAAAALLSLSMRALRRHGQMKLSGRAPQTTALVETGVYAIVRHPQYVAWPMLSAGLALVVQHWSVVLLAALSVTLLCSDYSKVDEDEGIAKFGEAYRAYMERVPGWNPIAGAWRLARRRAQRHSS